MKKTPILKSLKMFKFSRLLNITTQQMPSSRTCTWTLILRVGRQNSSGTFTLHLFNTGPSITPVDVPDMYQILLHGDDTIVRKNNLIGTAEHWGPEFKITVDIKINSFLKQSTKVLEIFRFASVEGNCCEIGQRLPALFSWFKNNTFHLTTNIGTEGNTWFDLPGFQEKKWYNFKIVQTEIEVASISSIHFNVESLHRF